MVKTLIDYQPASNRIEGLFERWYQKHPSHRPTVQIAHGAASPRRAIDPGAIKHLTARMLAPAVAPIKTTTPELRAAILAAIKADPDRLYKDIATEFDMVPSTIQRIANRHGIYRKKLHFTRAQSTALARQVANFAAQGLDKDQISARLHIKRDLVNYYLNPNTAAVKRAKAAS